MFMHKLIRVSTDKQIYTLCPTKPRFRVGRRRTFNDYAMSSRPNTQQKVSRTHCIFTFDPDQQTTFLTALETSFGTFLNGIIVDTNTRIPLNSGDLISLGDMNDANLQLRFVIDTDVEVVFENIPNPVQETSVMCQEEVKIEKFKKEEQESNENEPPSELRVRSVDTLTDENSSSRFVDLQPNIPAKEVVVKPEIRYPSTEEQESSDDHFVYSTVDYIDVDEEENFEETGETFEESDLKFKLQLQKQDVLAEYYKRLRQGREQVVDVITLTTSEEEDDSDEDDEISIVWRRLKPDQDKLVKFEVIKIEIDDDSEVEEVEKGDMVVRETVNQEQIEEEQIPDIHVATTGDESSSTSSANEKKKVFRGRSRSSGRRRRLPSTSDDESPDDKARRSKPKVLHRSRLEDFRNNVLKEQRVPDLNEASGNRRRTRSMSRGTETEFLMLPNDYKEQPRRSRSKSNLKSRSKSREKQNHSRQKQRSSRSKSRRQSYRKSPSTPTSATEKVGTRRKTRSMTRNEETEFVSLPQDYSRRRSASRPKPKLPVPEEKDSSSKIVSKKPREEKPVPDVSKSKDFQQRSSRNDQKASTSYQADSKRHQSSIERKTRSTSQSSTKSEGSTLKSKKSSGPKISSHVSEKQTKKRTRSQSKREEEENRRKKAKSASKDETATSLTSAKDNDALPSTSVEVPVVQEPLICEEISSIEPEVLSPRTVSQSTSNSHQFEVDLEATKTAPSGSKRIKVIDALPLITKRRRRLSTYSSPRRTDDEETELDERAGPSKKLEEPTKVGAPKKPREEKEKEKAEAKSRQKEYKIEEKRRHQKFPWAIIPGRKTSGPTSTMSNTEKKEIQSVRKETLKQQAIEKQSEDTRHRSMPRVKNCEKSRGEMLCADMNNELATPKKIDKSKDNNKERRPDQSKENGKPKESDQSPLMKNFLKSILKKKTGEQRIQIETRPRQKKIAFSEDKIIRFIPSNRLLRQKEKKRLEEDQRSASEYSSDYDEYQTMETIITRDEDSPSSSVVPDQVFPDSVIPDQVITNSVVPNSIVPDSIVPYSVAPDSVAPDSTVPDLILGEEDIAIANLNRQGITEENPLPVNEQSVVLDTGANISHSDATSRKKDDKQKVHQNHHRSHHRSKSQGKTARQPVAKESGLDLIWKILQWSPRWLEDRKKLNFEPPVTYYDKMVPLSDSYPNLNDYIEKMKPTILLEIWNRISKFHETNPTKNPPQKYFISKSRNENENEKPYVEKEIPNQKNKVYVSMELSTLVSQSGYVNESHPLKDSLATIRYKTADACQIMILFCYVTEVKRIVIRSPSDYDANLGQICAEPYAKVTLSVIMKKSSMAISDSKHEVLISRIGQIRPFIKIWEAIYSLNAHPTLCTVLNPAITPQRFRPQNSKSHPKALSNIISMADEIDLDEEQQRAVLETKRIFLQKEARILAINGLPGTGKTQVVVRIAAELFTDGFKKGGSKIIVCAATDAAVDELASRLIALNRKLSTNDKFKLIRVGETSDSYNDGLKKIQLRTLAEQISEIGKYNGAIRELNKKIEQLEKFLRNTSSEKYLEKREKLDSFRAQRKAMLYGPNAKKDILADEHLELAIKKTETKILMKADIILCTLELCTSKSMESVLSNCKEQVICIIDNASRCIEPQTLTPLLLGIKSLILVGNSEQYAIAHSWNAKFLGLKRSLFTRIVELSPENVITLKTQYRTTMAALRPFNEYYCDGKFEFSKAPNLIKNLRPYLILDHNGIEGTDQNEAFFVRKLIHAIWSTMDRTKPFTIGVIAHKDDLAMAIKREIFENIEVFHDTLLITVETYEKYENQERDVIIVASVLKILLDDLYVALTRAKHCLYLCANFDNPILKFVFSIQALLEDATASGTYKKLDVKLDPLDIKTQISRY